MFYDLNHIYLYVLLRDCEFFFVLSVLLNLTVQSRWFLQCHVHFHAKLTFVKTLHYAYLLVHQLVRDIVYMLLRYIDIQLEVKSIRVLVFRDAELLLNLVFFRLFDCFVVFRFGNLEFAFLHLYINYESWIGRLDRAFWYSELVPVVLLENELFFRDENRPQQRFLPLPFQDLLQEIVRCV